MMVYDLSTNSNTQILRINLCCQEANLYSLTMENKKDARLVIDIKSSPTQEILMFDVLGPIWIHLVFKKSVSKN
jgi:hypothetical protein